jgi:hypothetical protein
MVFNATFNNISVISCRSDLLEEETRAPGENYWPAASDWQTLSTSLSGIWTHNISGDSTNCIGSYKSIYHAIMTTMAPTLMYRMSSYIPQSTANNILILQTMIQNRWTIMDQFNYTLWKIIALKISLRI